MVSTKDVAYKIRLGFEKAWNIQKIFGFDYYDFTRDELRSPEYRVCFDEAYLEFRRPLRLAVLADLADPLVRNYAPDGVGIFINTALMNYLDVKDYAFCVRSEYNDFSPFRSAERFVQGMAVVSLKNPDNPIMGMNPDNPIMAMRQLLPFTGRLPAHYLPLQTGAVFCTLQERADELYENRDRKRKAGVSSNPAVIGEVLPDRLLAVL